MTSVLSSHPRNWSLLVQENCSKSRFNKAFGLEYSGVCFPSGGVSFARRQYIDRLQGRITHFRPVFSRVVDDGNLGDGEDEGDQDEESSQNERAAGMNNEFFREDLERIVGNDDSTFNGVDLATLIRNKYGRSYDVQLIKKEFMGRNLLAMNVMWKYMEQRSFPLTEEEYLLRLDDVANSLKCWGAVSHIRNSLAKLKERPRIGKAVSIFIDMDESGARSNEWIYK
eukprot:TRINITY_DN802_c0_g1_i1.p1 TRINITY_DN802_c0_g1~~TRINITY_DN802_c0_g1_i1.p1  ORF type:complete len:226 (+),score=31.71 TRINITY_DN802_c0_g1_i1:94-771(+)